MADTLSPQGHGTTHVQEQPLDISHIKQALEAVYSPQSSNEHRQAASSFLEDAKRHVQAPTYGYALASERTNEPVLRHYGLSMLEYCIRYTWETYSEEQVTALRMSVIEFAFDANEDDALYLRNKAAQLWLETAKRCWGVTWIDMDESLVKLWHRSPVHQHIVLSVLETLSEDTFKKEDASIALHEFDLGTACAEIYTPAATLLELFPNRRTPYVLRYGEEGWLQRMSDLLQTLMAEPAALTDQSRAIALKCVNAIRHSLTWIIFRSVVVTNCIGALQSALLHGNLSIQTAGVDALLALYSRTAHHDEADFATLADLIFTDPNTQLLRKLYDYSRTDLNDFDDAKYTLNKKLTELFNCYGNILEQRSMIMTPSFDWAAFFSILFDAMQNPSLMVSIPVLHIWTRFLRSRALRDTSYIADRIGNVLEICSRRLVRYENFPDDSDDPTYQFLLEDIDTIPERHAFLGNYRRYCFEVIEIVVRRLPVDAITHILQQAIKLFQDVADEQQAFRPETFTKNSHAALRIDAQAAVVDAAVKGYMKWLSNQSDDAQKNEADRNRLQSLFEQCGAHIMALEFRDPDLQRKILQVLVILATKPLSDQPSFAFKLLEHLLKAPAAANPDLQLYSEAVKSLQSAITHELSRLAMAFPDHFLTIFDDLERRISELLATNVIDERHETGYQAFLFILVHRSSGIDPSVQIHRLQQMLQPIQTAWQDSSFTESLRSFEAFCDLLGVSRLAEFIATRQFHKIQDWSDAQLDEDGRSFQSDILLRCNRLPLRLTKSLLAASTEKLEEGSPQWELASRLWADLIPIVLPNLLQLINYAQAFNNMQSWSSLPEEMQRVIQRILTDRFWQAGISTESRDDFFARVSSSKSSYEGFASTVRGSVRQIRETGYWIIYGFIRFKNLFYPISDLAEPLSHALYSNASTLSAHHFSVLLNMSVQLVEGCPPSLRAQFLPTIVSRLFLQVDKKLSAEWDSTNLRNEQAMNGDNLSEEMKAESILRQLTYTAASLAFSLLYRHRPNSMDERHKDFQSGASTGAEAEPPIPIYEFVLANDTILEPLLMFLKNSLRFHDSRSVFSNIRTMLETVPHLPVTDAQRGAGLRHFLADDLLKAAITSLNDPYFVEVQKDLASLIARVLAVNPAEGVEDLARSVLLSMRGLIKRANKVDSVLAKLRSQSQHHGVNLGERQQRAIILDLLRDVRGQSIQESGRIVPARGGTGAGKVKRERSKLQEQYMSLDEAAAAGGIGQGDEESLAGVAGMFQ